MNTLTKPLVNRELAKLRAMSKQMQDEIVKRLPDAMRTDALAIEDASTREWDRVIAAVKQPYVPTAWRTSMPKWRYK